MKELLPNKKIKSAVAFMLCAVCMAVMGSCQKPQTPLVPQATVNAVEEAAHGGIITVPYTSLDSVNPFFCASLLNENLVSLLYQPLYRLNTGFMPQACLAKSHTLKEKVLTVMLNENAVFSDGSPVTAEDVVYSFQKAKSSVLYQQSLKELSNARALSRFSVQFDMLEPDVNVLSLLTFPVVKKGSAENKTDIPTGSGLYVYKSGELRDMLTVNAAASSGAQIGTVRLYDVKDSSSSLTHLLDVGSVDCFYTDLSDSGSKRTYSGVNEVYLNNLVFLGFHYESYRLSSESARKGISYAIDRRAIAANAFVGHGRATPVPVNISWDEVLNAPVLADFTGFSQPEKADEQLNAFGAGSNGDTVYYRFIAPDSGSFMVNAAQMIVEQLKLVNIQAELALLPEKEYKKALSEGDYDIYLGEIKLTKNMDLSPFFSEDGAAVGKTDLELLDVDEVFFSYRRGETELNDFLSAFINSMPFVPILFRNGQFCYSRSILGTVEASEGFLFSSIEAWEVR